MRAWIRIRSLSEVERFLQIVCAQPQPVTLSLGSQRVDGKSRMAILSMNLTHPLELSVTGAAESLVKALSPFLLTLTQ